MNTNNAAASISTAPVIDNEYATLRYHPGPGIVHHVFHQPIAGEQFRAVVNAGVKLLQKHSASKWLSDDRMNFALPEEDTLWGKDNWFPRALEAGWKYWALVLPPDIKARINLKEFIDMFALQGMRIMIFTMPEDAMAWLTSVTEDVEKAA